LPGSTPPNVPRVFDWKSPASAAGESIRVLYLSGGYGGAAMV
jgi:hypothetical protein